MNKSEVINLTVTYKVKTDLTAKVVISIPDNSTLENPDGRTGSTFNMSAVGGNNDIEIRFNEVQNPRGRSRNNIDVHRTGYISLNNPFKNSQVTWAKLYCNGDEESEKSQTAAQYHEDPTEEIGDIK
jgi:hypothetical protein